MSLNIASIDWAEEKEMIQTSAHKQTKACVLDTRVNEVLPACRTPQKIPVSYTHLRAHETSSSISYAVFCL